jgi:hypothetical protein
VSSGLLTREQVTEALSPDRLTRPGEGPQKH